MTFYALVVGMVIHREIRIKDLAAILRQSAISSAVVMFIIGNAGMFAYRLTRAGVPDQIGHWLVSVLRSPAYFVLGITAALFAIGCSSRRARRSSCWHRSWCRWRPTSASIRFTSAW